MNDSDRAIYLATLKSDPVRFETFNPAQKRFIASINDPREHSLTICEFLKGNGLGGSWALIAAWSAIMFGTEHKLFKGLPFGDHWPFVKNARFISTRSNLTDLGPIQKAMREMFPVGRWSQNRGAGTSYYSEGKTDTGWTWDIMTYDQDVLQAAGHTKGLILFSEPPPQDFFYECCTRLRGEGMILLEMTQLDMAQFNENLVDEGQLTLDGKKAGDIRVVYGDVEEACKDHNEGGHRAHSAIEADIALWPEEEREARRTGKPLRISGRIYPKWGEENEIERLSEYHQSCWDTGRIKISCVIDPHDRRPWAMAWFATFLNNDLICFAEWPPFDFQACKSSPVSDIEDYREIILSTETEIGLPIWKRKMDPNFGSSPKSGSGQSIIWMLSKPCRKCPKEKDGLDSTCKHRLNFSGAPDSISEGHALVRSAIGDVGKSVRPKLFAFKNACPNFCRGMRRYAYREERNPLKALSEKPQFVFKDFPDLVRYALNSRLNEWPVEPKDLDLNIWRPKER